MAGATNILMGIKPFDGANFGNWSFRMKLVLEQNGVAHVLTEEAPTEQADLKKFKQDDIKARNIIVQGLADSILPMIKDKTTAKEMFDALSSTYEKKGMKSLVTAQKIWRKLEFKKDKSLQEFFQEFESLASEVKVAGGKLDEEEIVNQLLVAMPSDFDSVVSALDILCNKDKSGISLEYVKNTLLAEEERRGKKEEQVSAFVSYKHPKAKFTKTKDAKVNMQSSSFVGKCYYCKQQGHMKSNCPKLRNKHVAGVSKEEEFTFMTSFKEKSMDCLSVDKQVTCLMTPSEKVASLMFVVDSGASSHMVKNDYRPYLKDIGPEKVNISVAKEGQCVRATHKAIDASGRYNGGFLWGNNYWLGSAVHCRNVEPEPPFKLGFYVFRARIYLSETMIATKANRTAAQGILVGVCLPTSCSNEEAKELLNFSIDSAGLNTYRTVELSPVKNPNSVYEVTSDPVFWTLLSFTLIIFVLALIGTGLEIYEDNKIEKRKLSKFAYDNYTYEIAKSPEIQSPVNELKIPAGANNNDNSEGESSERNSVNSEEVVGKFTRIWKEVFISFSLKKNFSTICEKSVGDDTIPTIHGLRSISMAWVILGHVCIIAFKYSDNPAYRLIVEKELIFQTINKGAYSVDTFFFISGLLVSFLYFRTTSKHDITKYTKTTGFTSGFLEFISLIGYRFARLTVPYLFVLGCVQVSMKWFNHNSVFEPPTLDHVNCPQYWWRNLLYINTLYPVQDMCMLWSWYLADDTQFYVLGVILLILAVKYFKSAAALMAFFLVSSWCTTGFIAYTNNHIPNEDDPLALFDKIYDKPWTRLGPYIVGMSVGWLLFKTNCKIKMNKATVITGWTLTLGLLLFLVYGLFGTKLHPIAAAAFSSLSHTAWALGLSWIVIACSTGYGGYVTDILSSSLLYPFSRVTYCAYLIHPVVIRSVTMRLDSPLHLSPELVIVMYVGHLILSYIIAFVISLFFEAPMVSLLRIVSPTKRKSK